ncbi:YqgE/AlgH family protein [Nocardioides sp.]|uniref:YqgE/AlgH family protein n=1 Tax=Nocardioides sp. TaxID=35761 RepID=UPI002C46DCD2|nr:YqgE/AlgH family protein [Nocardioides sp.]HXH80242.1 YqgE/AlgH family protein [Nocardioides sp.]
MRSETEVAPGMLLLATAELVDPNFADSVVLLLDVSEEGALGVVLNRPSPVPVTEVLEPWGSLCVEPEVLFRGGPVSPDGALAVALLRDAEHEPVGFRPILGRLGMVDLDTPVELLDGTLSGLRVYAGYAGWDAQQLRAEIAEGSWYAVTAEPVDAFRSDTSDLWRDVLRRQPGQLAWHTTRPLDPDLN